MKVVRAKRAIFVLTALLSLVTSTIAACGCSHHEIAAAPVETSCHGTNHEAPEQPETMEEAASGDKLETGCNCFVREPGPSLSSKSRIPTDSSHQTPVELSPFEVDRKLVANSAGTASYYSAKALYNSRHGTRAPARAPPRL
jgi:hypothetical protein